MGKGIFTLGIIAFLAGTVGAVLHTWHHVVMPPTATTFLAQILEMGKQLWLPETLALGFFLVCVGLMTWNVNLGKGDSNGTNSGGNQA